MSRGFNWRGPWEVIIDTWSPLSHKAPLHERTIDNWKGWLPQTWVGHQNHRRIVAYQILAAYASNVSRWLVDTDNEDDIENRREYGDVGLLLDTVVTGVLGESQEVVVVGAADYDAKLSPDAPPDVIARNAESKILYERQDFLRKWADDVQLETRLINVETDAAQYGDGVILLGWNPERKRPIPAVIDPGFYFPVLPDSLDGYDYPNRVHFAWELPGEGFTDKKARVRRITYDLRPIDKPAFENLHPEQAEGAETGYTSLLGINQERGHTGDNDEPELAVEYPWAVGSPSKLACYMTDATWLLEDIETGAGVDSFNREKTETIAKDADGNPIWEKNLGIDFLPIIHIPNTPSTGGDHFGQSTLSRVLQLVDDLQNADTDVAASSATTGTPIVSISGDAIQPNMPGGFEPLRQKVEPGAVWRVGQGGRMDVLNTAPMLEAGDKHVIGLRDRLMVNSRIPTMIVGTTEPTRATGVALELSFGPYMGLVRKARAVRKGKYGLLLKMVQRMYQAYGVLPATPEGELPQAQVSLGAYLPRDRAAAITEATDGLAGGVISLETAVTLLMDAGFPIEDVSDEIRRIQQRAFDKANALADATGDQGEVRKFLGLEPADEVPKAPVQPPKPDQPPLPPTPIAGGSGVGTPNPTDSGNQEPPA